MKVVIMVASSEIGGGVMNDQDAREDGQERCWKLAWNIQLGIRYHMHMQNFYGRFGKFVTIFTLILSTSAGATLFGSATDIAKILAFMAALLQAFELVIDSKSKLTLHTTLRQKYIQLGAELAVYDSLIKDDEARFKAKIALIEVEEPPIIYSLMDSCHNELVKSHKLEASNYELLSFPRNIIAWWYN